MMARPVALRGLIMGTDKSTVGIIGGGFAGVACAKRLAGKPDAQVTLSDGSAILTRLCVWGGGLQAADVVAASGLPRGRGERIDVGPELTVARKATSPPCRNSGPSPSRRGGGRPATWVPT